MGKEVVEEARVTQWRCPRCRYWVHEPLAKACGVCRAVQHQCTDWRIYIELGDIERCPYPPFTQAATDWGAQDDERIKARVLARHPELG